MDVELQEDSDNNSSNKPGFVDIAFYNTTKNFTRTSNDNHSFYTTQRNQLI